jgi:hypothetical protein
MRKASRIFVLVVFILQIIFITPLSVSGNDEVEWVEELSVSGTCSTDNIRRHIQVNSTVVEIIVNLTWGVNSQGANLDMWIEHTQGFVVNASDSEDMPEVMRVSEFPNRGKWTLVIIPISCGSSGEAYFTANVSLRNIALPGFEISGTEIELGDNVTMTLSSQNQNVSQYFFDFGDGTDSGWIGQSSISRKYENSGEYLPKGKVQYSHGMESDWVEVGSIEIKDQKEDLDILLIAQVTLIIMIIITVLVFIIIKKRKGV